MKYLYVVGMYVFNNEFNINTDTFIFKYNYIRSYGEHMYEFVYYPLYGFSRRKIVHVNDFDRTFILNETKDRVISRLNNHKEIVTYVVSDNKHLTSSEILTKVRDSLITYLKNTSGVNKKDKSSILTIVEKLNELNDPGFKIPFSGL